MTVACSTSAKSQAAHVPQNVPTDGAALYERDVHHTRLLTTEEEGQLSRLIKTGGAEAQAALDRFITANQRLVWDRARRFQGRGLDWADLVQEGNLGLLKAIGKFDPDRGNKFSTMAIWWIDQAMSRALDDTARIIRVPVHQQSALRQLRKEEMRLCEELDHLPTDEELAEASGLPRLKVAELRQIPECGRSLSAPLLDEDELELATAIADPSTCVEAEALDAAFSHDVLAVLEATLSPRERLIVQKRFGLGKQDEERLVEIGRELGITRERVRQIEKKALRKLQQSPQLRALAAAL